MGWLGLPDLVDPERGVIACYCELWHVILSALAAWSPGELQDGFGKA